MTKRTIMFNPTSLFQIPTNHEKWKCLQNWYQNINFTWKEFYSYYSAWCITVFFIPFQTNLFQYMKMNMILHASLGGAYITYIYPRTLNVYYMNLILDGFLLKIMDFLAHHTFLLYYLLCVENRPSLSSCGSFIDLMLVNSPFIIYFCNFNIGYRYGLRMYDLAIICMVYMMIMSSVCFI